MIFRPYRRNFNSFFDFQMFLFLALMSGMTLFFHNAHVTQTVIFTVSQLLFASIIFIHLPYWITKRIWNFCQTCKENRQRNSPLIEELGDIQKLDLLVNDDNWIADRIEHPDKYNEHHVKYVLDDLNDSQHQKKTVHSDYGGTNNQKAIESNNFDVGQLFIRNTESTIKDESSVIPQYQTGSAIFGNPTAESTRRRSNEDNLLN